MPKFEIGQRYYTPNGRTVEICGVETVKVEAYGVEGSDADYDVEVVAFRFVGMHHVHIRKAEDMENWPAIPMEV